MSRAKAWEYAEEILDIPKRRVPVTLRHGKSGMVVLHQGRVMTRCYNSRVGRVAARYVAAALGVEAPEVGESVEAAVSTGVLFRAISIASLDLRKPETHPILARMLEEAQFQRG